MGSLDVPLFKPPYLPDGRGEEADALPIHWDVDPRERHLLQGMLYLIDSPDWRGAFRCVPALFPAHAEWLERRPDDPLFDIDVEGHDIVTVPCRAAGFWGETA